MYHKVRPITELAVSAQKALTSKSSGGEGCAAGQGQDGIINKKENIMIAAIAEVELGTARGKGSILEVPRDNRGDDSLYLVYTAEELRWMLREMGVIGKDSQISRSSPYSEGQGVVFSLDNNKDEATGSYVYLMNIMWALGRYGKNEGGYDHTGCVTQSFRRRGSYEALCANFFNLPEGRHTYALGLGYDLQFGRGLLGTCTYTSYRVGPEDARVRRIPVQSRPLFKNTEPFIVVFDFDATKRGLELGVSLEIKIPDARAEYSDGWFHHIQLVQID